MMKMTAVAVDDKGGKRRGATLVADIHGVELPESRIDEVVVVERTNTY